MDINKLNNTPFFFIIGRPRSGTTLLRTMLDAHPHVIIPLELAYNLEYANHRFKKIKRWQEKDKQELFNYFCSESFTKYPSIATQWNIDKELLKNNIFNAPDDTSLQTFIKIIYSHYKSVFPKKEILAIGDKTPLHSMLMLQFYKNAFSDAKFIFLIRDPRDHIRSHNLLKPLFPTAVMADMWRKSAEQYVTLKEKAPKQIILVRYEDLISNTPKKLNEICNFLNIPFSESMLKFHTKKQKYESGFVNQWQKKLYSPPDKKNKYLWKEKMSKAKIKKIEFYCGSFINRFNYERYFPKFSLVYYLAQLPFMMHVIQYEFSRKIYNLLPVRFKHKIRNRKFIISAEIYKILKKRKRIEA